MRRLSTIARLGVTLLSPLVIAATAAGEPSAPVGGSELAGIEKTLAAREYEASPNAGGLQAPNRAHNLRTWFESGGIRVHDRTAEGSPELLGLRLMRAGRARSLTPVLAGEVVREGARVAVRRPGLVEWYVNSEAGLEQGFTLAEPPRGRGEVAIELWVDVARAKLAGDRVVFTTPSGRQLEYGKLAVQDADGRALPARFEVPAPDRLRLVADDSGARYPLVFDPILTGSSEFIFSSGQLNARLGLSVASAGDVNGDGYADVIAGAYQYDSGSSREGRAWVLYGSAAGINSSSPSVIDSNEQDAELGLRVASAGDVNGDGYSDVIVGARFYNNGGTDEGGAFVFHGGPSGIVANGNPSNANAVLDSNQANSEMGRNVAGIGDVNGDGYGDVAVSAAHYNSGEATEGSVFVFLGSPSGVGNGNPSNADAELESDESNSDFGVGLAGAGDVNGDGYDDLIVGAPFFRNPDEGAAFIFLGSGSGIASASAASAASILESNQTLGIGAQFGWSVASAGDVNGDGYSDVIVGAVTYDNPVLDGGAAFIFHGSSTGVVASGSPSNANTGLYSSQASGFAGISVGGAGDVNGDGFADVIVGAFGFNSPTNDEGAAWVFKGGPTGVASATELSAYAKLTPPAEQGAQFGAAVAGAGDVNGDGYADVVVGAWLQNSGATDAGSIYTYHGGAEAIAGPNAAFAGVIEANQGSAHLGWSVASAGDVNGDGFSDVIVGAYTYDAGEPDEGAAFLFFGGASGIPTGNPTSAAARLEADQNGAALGYSVASAGDVNGDGYGDVIVGAPYFSSGEAAEGAAFVFLGNASGISNGNPGTAAAQLESNQGSAQFGWSVASAGDVNGDGYGDVIVGAPAYDAGESDEGAAFIFQGGASGIANGNPSTAAAQLESDQGSAALGWSVASAGDVNGDGYGDVILGAQIWDAQAAGAAFIFQGGASGIASQDVTTAAGKLESNQGGARLGVSVASAGDVNGDGYADVIVGAYQYNQGQAGEGAAFVFHGSSAGIANGNPGTAATRLEANEASALMGASVASAGDVNGDGYADVIVGAHLLDAGALDAGAALVFLGGSSGIPNGNPFTAAAQLVSDHPSTDLGFSVAGAGDVNGDGFADVIVGAHLDDRGLTDEGAAFLWYGNGNRNNRAVLARQLRGDAVPHPVQPWALSQAAVGDFQVRARATHPQGRGRVKLQVEACPAGNPFVNNNCTTVTSPSWTDATATSAGATLTQSIFGLTPGALYRWRARVLYAPFSVNQAGITAAPNPAHGPWRRLFGQALEGDIRMAGDFDDDDDGVADIYESDTGIYVGVTNTGTDPLDPDSDDDSLPDGAEVALGLDPNNPDTDGDTANDGSDNCPYIVNASQANNDAMPAGDVCQCGNVDATGGITSADYTLAREAVVKTPGGSFNSNFCDVNDDSSCDVEDLAILQRIINAQPANVLNGCQAYGGP